MLRVLMKNIENMQDQMGIASTVVETFLKKSNENVRNQKQK